jgi:hypothetical protein
MLGPMKPVTPDDRDRAVRRLTVVTGGIAAASITLTGGLLVMIEQEADQARAVKAHQQSAVPLAGGSSLVRDTSGAAQSATQTPIGSVHVYSTPTATPTGPPSSVTPSASRAPATRTTPRRTTAPATAPATATPVSAAAAVVVAPTTAAAQTSASTDPAPAPPPQTQAAQQQQAPAPVQSSGS